jgi:PKD repeat protein
VNFSDLSSGGISYQWTFGDGGVSATQNPSYTYTSTGTYTITLVTQSAFGCIDSSVQSISVDYPVLDMAVVDLKAVKSSNTIQVLSYLKNTGTLDVTNIELSAYLDDGTPIHEFWTGFAKRDTVIPYLFSSSFELVNNLHSIVCVEVKKVNGQADDVSANNKKCTAITEEFVLLNPFPNPTIGEINFFFISPDGSHVLAQIFDDRGRLIATPFDGNASKGLNQIIFNTIKLEKSMYVLKLLYKDKVATKVFLKE